MALMSVGKRANEQLQKLVRGLKSRLMRPVSMKKAPPNYDRMEKTESMRVEMKSRKAQKLIADTLCIYA
ncbi:hypothetical protein KSP39_PZI018307 [Platanthera zijinensis]|uniref:Uncharacterized protein n=1 Tax=Platanthera zijinensis TaxID=2320716 RepID=A0AAP0B3V3_9ASPA